MYADVVFPLRLPPLTYRIPEGLPGDIVGRIVEAPLMGRASCGLVVSVSEESGLKKGVSLKEITGVLAPFATAPFLSFLSWLSDYYIMPMGSALKAAFFEDCVRIMKSLEVSAGAVEHAVALPGGGTGEAPSEIARSIRDGVYKTFLLHAPSASAEHGHLMETLGDTIPSKEGMIILVPEISHLERLFHSLRELTGERVSVLHSRLSKGRRNAALERILSGHSDIVVGTRSAILAPVRGLSIISVMAEHSPSYKGMEGMRYHGRDVAVMRGFLESSSVLLSSVCPSAESVHNCRIGKYQMVDHSAAGKRPRIRIMDMRRQEAALSGEVLKKTEGLVRKGEKVLFLMNRKGYSLLRCGECGHIPRCPGCALPVVFHKGDNLLRCPACGFETAVQEQCEQCRGVDLRVLGAGTERVSEELEKALGLKGVLLEKGASSGQEASAGTVPFVVGTSPALRRVRAGLFSSAVVLNTDLLLSLPDFRAHERALQEIIQVSQMVSPEGTIFLQTLYPREEILRFIRDYDFSRFYDAELSLRREMSYPPFSRIIAVSLVVKDKGDIMDRVRRLLPAPPVGTIIMGPVEAVSPRKGLHCLQIILKSPDRRSIRLLAREVVKRLEEMKKGKIIIDVDPLRI